MDGIAASVWEQVSEQRKVVFDGHDPAVGMSESEKEDVRWLLQACSVQSKEALLAHE
jgi:hypothetical protein